MTKLIATLLFLSLGSLSHAADLSNSTQMVDDANYDKMKTLFDQAKEVPSFNDFESIHQATAHPLHCVGYTADGTGPFVTQVLVAQRTVQDAVAANGPLVPAQPAKVETKILALASTSGIEMVSEKQSLWDGVTDKFTSTELNISSTFQMGSDAIKNDGSLRKNGQFVTFKLRQALNADKPTSVYGYCFRSQQEKWVATGDVRVPDGDGYHVSGGWGNDDDKVTAEKNAMEFCKGESGGRTCTIKSVQNGCVSSAYDSDRNFYQATAQDSTDALSKSVSAVMELCKAHGSGCREYTEYCSDGWNAVPGAAD